MSENNNDNKLNSALERYGNNAKAVTKKKDRSGIIILIVITLFVILVKNCGAETSSNSSVPSSSSTCKCDYCGKYENCERYFLVLNIDVHTDYKGDIKMDGDYVWLSSDCYKKMRDKYSYEIFYIEKR